MNLYKIVCLFFVVVIINSCSYEPCFREYSPATVFWDGDSLLAIKKRIHCEGSSYLSAYKNLLEKADEALKTGPFSVTAKEDTPPSGDKHDYMSVAPYWWPDSTKKDGLPYIQRDGLRNPESNAYDKNDFRKLKYAVKELGLAYYFSDNEIYAEYAAKLLRVWFIDPWTKMNPHLEFAQAVKGREDGRNFGIIETSDIGTIADISELLVHSPSWSEYDYKELKGWFKQYLTWLLESEKGHKERDWHNNHGTWYDVQVTSLALSTGDEDVAKKTLQAVFEKRITAHIMPDGSQPFELERTRSFHYSVYNLRALMILARLGERVGVDLWKYETENGASIKKAFDYLLPYLTDQSEWTYKMVSGWEEPRREMLSMLKMIKNKFSGDKYESAEKVLREEFGSEAEYNLLSPPLLN